MMTKVKALVWEECRVGGILALSCALMGSSFLLYLRLIEHQEDYLAFIVGTPLGIAVLLILNPNYKGLLQGGFSERILQLPIPTVVPVTVTLLSRISFLFLATVLMVAVGQALFKEVPGFTMVLPMLAVYLILQGFDWLRVLISGLTSFVLVSGAGTLFWMTLREAPEQVHRRTSETVPYVWESSPGLCMVGIVALFTLVYGLSFFTVNATRVGRRYGIPEIWTWHKHISVPASTCLTPFGSAMRAQVWLELRRSAFLLPIVTVGLTTFVTGGVWAYLLAHGDSLNSGHSISLIILPFVALMFGTVANVSKAPSLKHRATKGMPGYTYLQAMTTEEYAYARTIANALLLFPTLIFVLVFHFTFSGTGFVFDIIPEALSLGTTSMREVVWVLLSRGIAVGLLAWVFMSGTRIVAQMGFALVWVPFATWIIVEKLVGSYGDPWKGWSNVAYCVLLILVCVGAYARAWRARLISTRSLLLWGGLWGLMSWVIYGQAVALYINPANSLMAYLAGICVCVGIATLVPLPFVGTVLDLRKKRHSAAPRQSPTRFAHIFQWNTATPQGKSFVAVGMVLVLGGVWLGIPDSPAYHKLWKSMGYPVTLEEANDFYPAVPDEKNAALQYLAIAEISEAKGAEFYLALNELNRTRYYEKHNESIMFNGSTRVEVTEEIPAEVLARIEEYWQEVTRHVAPALKAVAAQNLDSRYPVDMRGGYGMDLAHLDRVRGLGRHLSLDALHWTLQGDSAQATDSILALLALGDSLEKEPVYMSELVRNAVYGIAFNSVESSLNRGTLREQDLIRIQQAYALRSDSMGNRMTPGFGLIGESVIALNGLRDYLFEGRKSSVVYAGTLSMRQLVAPIAAEHMVAASTFAKILMNDSERSFSDLERENDTLYGSFEVVGFIAPISSIMMSQFTRDNETQLCGQARQNSVLTAMAVERYHLAQGHLPETLEALVPTYLDRVPVDPFSDTQELMRYRLREEGGYVLYSIGIDMEDDGGTVVKKRYREGDLIFTVRGK